ncbi:MAG TPA: UDP-N-acetylmuramoyl-tripeptide--D-alanyl-D-alanine ligase [Burkholderiaceae bacterium]|nr:UDP-N-acetylmuramoyl-tripeptide--D-alanyl-D-alanine ligase [Burkholderiaceae bacterium]
MMTLAQAAAFVPGSRVRGAPGTVFNGVSTDTRTIAAGCLFVALRGPRFDGHDYTATAVERGAAALLVEREFDLPCPQLVVADSRRSLGMLGAGWRSGFRIPVIAVTGSNGKTTVTQMIAAILAKAHGASGGRAHWCATRGNLNNDIGVPLMLLELRSWHRAAAFELGMNHPGEIAYLAQLARPTVGLVNNAQREHQEFMPGVEATARENAAVLDALPPDGVAVFPADDPCASIWRRAAGTRRVLDFGLHESAAVTANHAPRNDGTQLEIATPAGEIAVTMKVVGEHNVRNALAACACALAVGIAPTAIASGLAAFTPVGGRGVREPGPDGTTLIDDTYNANPDSVRAAIDVLAAARPPRLLVLGDMGEVGASGVAFHREIGAYAALRGIERLFATGPLMAQAVAAFGPAGRHFEAFDDLVAAVLAALERGTTLLVKGSRFMRMERVLAAVRAAPGSGG